MANQSVSCCSGVLENKDFDPGDLPVEAVDVVVGLHEELVGEVGLVGVDDDRLGEVLQNLDDGVVVLAVAALVTSCVNLTSRKIGRLYEFSEGATMNDV